MYVRTYVCMHVYVCSVIGKKIPLEVRPDP